jgi:hypothetical protein
MLTLGAMMLLSFLILRVNSTQVNTYGTIVDSKLGIVGITVANTYMDFAKRQVFDAVVRDSTITVSSYSDFTVPSLLGPDIGEVYPDFDDVDDFNLDGAVIVDTTTLTNSTNLGLNTPFFITSEVFYVDQPNFDTKVNYTTWFKKLTVKVWADGMIDTITYSSIATFW